MNKYAKIKLREYESEETINDFLEKKNIPEVFSKGIGAIKISDMLFSNLQAIQAKGGLEYLTNGIAQIDAISQRVNEIINSIIFTIFPYIILQFFHILFYIFYFDIYLNKILNLYQFQYILNHNFFLLNI